MKLGGNLGRALGKVKHYHADQWCGYLTPSEILALLEAGAMATSGSGWEIAWAKRKKDSGESRPTWFYFSPRKELREMLPEREHKKVGTAAKV